MVFDLCGDISERLDKLELGTLVGYLTPDGGAWATSSLGGPLMGELGNRAQGKGRAFTLDPPLSRKRVPAA